MMDMEFGASETKQTTILDNVDRSEVMEIASIAEKYHCSYGEAANKYDMYEDFYEDLYEEQVE